MVALGPLGSSVVWGFPVLQPARVRARRARSSAAWRRQERWVRMAVNSFRRSLLPPSPRRHTLAPRLGCWFVASAARAGQTERDGERDGKDTEDHGDWG